MNVATTSFFLMEKGLTARTFRSELDDTPEYKGSLGNPVLSMLYGRRR